MTDPKNRRQYARIKASIPLRFKKLDGNDYIESSATTKDLSEGGAKFQIDKFISLSSRLIIRLKFPLSPDPIKVVSKVAWIKKLPVDGIYEVGNHFLAMSKADESALTAYLGQNSAKLT